MTEKFSEAQALELMETAFCAPAQDPVHGELRALLERQPEFQSLWEEFLQIRRGAQGLEASQTPSALTRARILQAARRRAEQKSSPGTKKVWRWLLSQPVVAAATIALFIGFGIYAHYWRQDMAPEPTGIPAGSEAPLTKPPSKLDREPADTLEDKAISPAPPPAPHLEKKAMPPPKPARAPAAPKQPFMAPTTGGVAPEAEPAPVPAGGGKGSTATTPMGAADREAKQRRELPAEAPAMEESEGPMEPQKALQQAPAARSKAKTETFDLQESPDPKLWLSQAKSLMEEKKYREALVLLKRAQKYEDNEEIRRLIAQCRAALMKQ